MAHSPRYGLAQAQSPTYLSSRSANALISDLRPTQLHPQALQHLNLLLDELVVLLLKSARSLNTEQIKHEALTSVFGGETGARSLGRTAVSEAEIELRSWMAAKAGRATLPSHENGFIGVADFALDETVALLRAKIVAFSTLAAQPPNPELDARLITAFEKAGGDPRETVWAPASLYVTAIIEHVCEHILSNVGRVVARDSSIAVATLQDLYVALCEDESIWGLFKRMQVKESIEAAMRPSDRHRRTQSRNAASPAGSPVIGNSTPDSPSLPSAASRGLAANPTLESKSTPPVRGKKTSNASSSSARPSADSSPSVTATGGIAHVVQTSPSSRGLRSLMGSKHERSPSVLSHNTRSMLGAYDEAYGSDMRTELANEADFDALVKSGETMKVSLTPSRLKNFESTSQRNAIQPRTSMSQSHRDLASRASPSLRPSASMTAMSGPKLVPRDIPVKEEDIEDDELASKPKRRKESLMELLNSDPPWQEPDAPPRRGSGGKAAAMLGAVPSTGGKAASMLGPNSTVPRSSSQVKLQPRNDAKSPLDDDENDLTFGDKPRKKSTAQELMDFLDNTPPPPETPRAESLQTATVNRKDSRFKSLVSKFTGSKEKEKDAGLQAPPVRKQKSFQSTTQPSAPVSRQSTRVTEAPPTVARTPEAETRGSEITSTVTVERKNSKNGKLRKAPSFERSARTAAPTLGAVIPIEDHYIGPSTGDDVVTSRDRPLSGAPFTGASIIGLGMHGVNLHQHEPTSSSNATEDLTPAPQSESDSAEVDTPATTVSDLTPTIQQKPSRPLVDTTPKPATSLHAESALPVPQSEEINEQIFRASDLIPLRGLLDHATSARECRLLLSAVLSQWGVPQAKEEADITPESRVTAWLLAGREGPIEAISPTTEPQSEKSVEPEVTTESLDDAVRRSMDRSDVEVLSEFTDASDSLADLDVENDGSASTTVAKRQTMSVANAEIARQPVAI